MDVRTVGVAVVGGWSVDVIVQTLLSSIVTGTTIADQLMTGTLPLIVGAGTFISVLRLFLA